MKRQFLLSRLLLLFALIVGSGTMWAGTVTRTENFSSSKASSDQYNCGSQASTVANQSDWNYTWTPSGSAYVFKSGIRLGTGSATGTVTNTTMLSGISTGTSVTIKVYAAVWNNDGGSLVVTYNGNSDTKAPSNSKITDTSASYSSSDFSTSTNFSITKAEGVTSFSIASSTKRIIIDKVEVVYDDGPAKKANDLAWSADSKSVTYSETPYGLPTLTNPHSLAVTYESTDESVATVAADGTVTIKNVTGSTSISASTEGDATYASGTVSYTLNVTRKFVLEDGVFDFAFSPAEGGGYGSEVTQNGSLVEGSTSTWTSGNIVLTIANRYAWNSDGTLRAYKSTSNYEASEITISCPLGNAITQIDFTGPYTGTGKLSNIAADKGTYAVTSSSAIWTGAAQSVSFTASNSTYINTITVTYSSTVPVTITTAGLSTYVGDCDLNYSGVSDLKAYKAKVTDNSIAFTKVTTVPAGEGVLLRATSELAESTVFNIPVATSVDAWTADANDFIRGTGATVATQVGSNYNYILSTKGGVVGFYNANGNTVAKNRAYLSTTTAPPTNNSRLSTTFDDDETTGINAVENVEQTMKNAVIYNLNGQRVVNPIKGLYIVNGKKVIFNK